MYKNNVESLMKASDFRENLQEKIGHITDEQNYSVKIAILPRFEQVSPT